MSDADTVRSALEAFNARESLEPWISAPVHVIGDPTGALGPDGVWGLAQVRPGDVYGLLEQAGANVHVRAVEIRELEPGRVYSEVAVGLEQGSGGSGVLVSALYELEGGRVWRITISSVAGQAPHDQRTGPPER